MKKFTNGVIFGLMLQLAVGPTCLYLLNVSIIGGFFDAITGVLAVVTVDALYIVLAIIGISKFLNKKRIKFFKIFGGLILIIFGCSMILSFFNLSIIPQVQAASIFDKDNVFLFATILTLSNPLTIIFWSGIFTSKMLEDNYGKLDLILFSLGCLFATLSFLSLISGAGTMVQKLFTEDLIKIVNVIIGIVILIFGVKLMFSKIENTKRKK